MFIYRVTEVNELTILTNSSLNLSDHSTGLNKKKLAGILVGCIVFIVIMVILGVAIHRNRKKKLENLGNLSVILT